MTETISRSQTVYRWYTRPVFFVADVNRAARFFTSRRSVSKRVGTKVTAQAKSARLITVSARSSSARMPRVETEHAYLSN